MSDTTVAASDAIVEVKAPETPPDTGDAPDANAELEKWKAQARKHEERAKANAQAAKELEQLKQQSMSDIEKAVAQAKLEGRTEGLREASTRLAAAAVKAAAVGRFDVTDEFIEGVNLAAFIDEDGEVDEAKVAKFVDGIAPKAEDKPRFPDLGQGPRRNGNPLALNGDPLLQSVINKLNS